MHNYENLIIALTAEVRAPEEVTTVVLLLLVCCTENNIFPNETSIPRYLNQEVLISKQRICTCTGMTLMLPSVSIRMTFNTGASQDS